MQVLTVSIYGRPDWPGLSSNRPEQGRGSTEGGGGRRSQPFSHVQKINVLLIVSSDLKAL